MCVKYFEECQLQCCLFSFPVSAAVVHCQDLEVLLTLDSHQTPQLGTLDRGRGQEAQLATKTKNRRHYIVIQAHCYNISILDSVINKQGAILAARQQKNYF